MTKPTDESQEQKIQTLFNYALAEAKLSGVTPPVATPESLDEFFRESGYAIYGGRNDPNHDARKRQLGLGLYWGYSLSEIREQGREWLSEHPDVATRPAHVEWRELIDSSDEVLVAALFHCDEESTRQRLSSAPASSIMDPLVALRIKRHHSFLAGFK